MTDIDAIKAEADKGNADAQYRLANTLRQDEDSPKALVREWFQKAADQGHAVAQYVIATDFLEEYDPESKSLLLAAAEQGHAAACMDLCYFEIEWGPNKTCQPQAAQRSGCNLNPSDYTVGNGNQGSEVSHFPQEDFKLQPISDGYSHGLDYFRIAHTWMSRTI